MSDNETRPAPEPEETVEYWKARALEAERELARLLDPVQDARNTEP